MKKIGMVVLLLFAAVSTMKAAQTNEPVISDVGGVYPTGQTAVKDGDSVRIKAFVSPANADSVWASGVSVVDTTKYTGNVKHIILYDDGQHEDGLANDGTFASVLLPVKGKTSYAPVIVFAAKDTFWNYGVGSVGVDNFLPFIGASSVIYPGTQTAAKDGDNVRVKTYMDDISSYVDVSLMIDNSGSMADTATGDSISKMEAAKHAADTFLTQLGDSDRADLWTFYDPTWNTAEETLKVALTYNKQEVIDSVNTLYPGGGTPLYDATVEAVRYVDSLSNRIAAAIILTDGKDTKSNEYTRQDCYFLPIPVFTIGFGDTGNIDTAFLDSVAITSGGKFYIAPNSAQLDSIYRDIQTIIANIKAPKGIAKAWVNAVPVGADSIVPYFDDGDHEDGIPDDSVWGTALFKINNPLIISDSVPLGIVAKDVAYNSKTSTQFINIDNNPPVAGTLNVTYPSGKNVVHNGEKVYFSVKAQDFGTISGIQEVYLDATQVGGGSHIIMRDDGTGNDAVAGDSVYTSDSVTVNTDTYSGTAAVYAHVLDIAGNSVVSAGGVVVDNIAPVITDISITYPSGQTAVKQGDTIKITAEVTDDISGVDSVNIDMTNITGGVFQMVDDGTGGDVNANDNVYTYVGIVTASTTGNANFTITAKDNEQNTSSVNSYVVIDNTPPQNTFTISILDPDNIYSNGETVHLRVNADAPGYRLSADFSTIDFYYVQGAENWSDNSDGTYDISYTISDNNTMADGQYLVLVTLYDEANNTTAHNVILALDNNLPVVDTVYLSDADDIIGSNDTLHAVIHDNKGVIAGEFFIDAVSGNGQGHALSLDVPGADTVSGSAVIDINTMKDAVIGNNSKYLADGKHKIYVHGEDSTGNYGAYKTLEFTVDRDAPHIDNVQVIYPEGQSSVKDGDTIKVEANIYDITTGVDSIWIDGSNLNGVSDIQMYDDGTNGDAVSGDGIYTSTIVVSTGGANGNIGFGIHAIDVVPNERVINSYVVVDNTAPSAMTIQVTDPDNIYRNGEEIHLLITTDASSYKVSGYFGNIDSGYLTGSENVQDNGDGTYSMNYRITVTNTRADGNYYVPVVVKDNAGNSIRDSILLVLDNNLPVVDTVYLSDADDIIGSNDTLHAVIHDNKGVIAGEFFIDAVSGNGQGHALSLDVPGADTVSGSAVIDINTMKDAVIGNNSKYLADGKHKIYVHGEDSTGNYGAYKTLEFTVDRDAPHIDNVQVIYPEGQSSVKDGDTIKVEANIYDITTGVDSIWIDGSNLNGVSDIQMYDDGTNGDAVSGDGIYTSTIVVSTGGANGNIGFGIHAIDVVPNERVINSYVVVDNTAPSAMTIQVTDPDNIYRNGEEIHLLITTDASSYKVSGYFGNIDSGYLTGSENVQDNGDGTYSMNYRITVTNTRADGNYYVPVVVKDNAGNSIRDSILLVLDNIGAVTYNVDFVLDPLNDNILNAPDTIIAWLYDHKGVIKAEYFIDNTGNNGSGTPMILDNPGADSVVAKAYLDIYSLTEGKHTVYVHGEDSTGNYGDYKSLDFVIDTTPPAIEKVTVNYPEGQTEARLGQKVVISALVTDRVTAVDPATVLLDGTNINGDSAILMVDNGTNGDMVAGDNVYTAEVTVTNDSTGTFDFTISAQDIVPNAGAKTGQIRFDNGVPNIEVSYSPDPKNGDEVYQSKIILTVNSYDVPDSFSLRAIVFDVYNLSGDVVYHKDINEIPSELTFKEEIPLIAGFNYIRVKSIDSTGNQSVYSDTINYIVPEVSQVVGPEGDTVKAPDGTKLIIPKGALLKSTEIKIKTVPKFSLPSTMDTGIVLIKAGHEIEPSGITFHKPVELIIPYTSYDIDPDHDGMANYSEDSLTVFYYDSNDWLKVGNVERDTINNTLKVELNHLSLFTIGIDRRILPNKVLVYLTRNPFRVSDGTSIVYSLPAPGKITIKIYDLSGDLVRTVVEDVHVPKKGQYTMKWYGKSDYDKYHGSGIYIYRLEYKSDDGKYTETVKKPLGIIR